MSDTIRVSRSAIEERLKCARSRYLGFHYKGRGLSREGAKYEALFGQCVHERLAQLIIGSDSEPSMLLNVGIQNLFKDKMEGADFTHFFSEQMALYEFLTRGWDEIHHNKLLDEYVVVNMETETSVILKPELYLPSALADMLKPVTLPLRLDMLLRRRSDGLLFIGDFKTTSQASEDWNITLDNSLQSHIYCTAAEILYKEPIGGIIYYGLVKGRREMDKARSSPYQGRVIQYGSPLYGWQDKQGKIHSDYISGRTRIKLFPGKLEQIKSIYDIRQWFPVTVPWKPLESGHIMGQIIVNENKYANDLEMYNEIPDGHPTKPFYEQTLFEQNLNQCFKYGTKHPCQFVQICHEHIHEDEINSLYTERVDHHD